MSGEPAADDVRAFERFVDFFRGLFGRPDFLRDVPCTEKIRDYVPRYYRKTFGPAVPGMLPRHWKWLQRLAPVLSLPRGSRIIDYGAGYGLDSIFLASRGYRVVPYEISASHIAVQRYLRDEWVRANGPVEMTPRLRVRGASEDFGRVDALLLDEVAHHIEPVAGLFARCASIVPSGGRLFLLESSFFNPLVQAYFFRVRGFRTTLLMRDEETGEPYLYGNENIRPLARWRALAARAGFALEQAHFVVPWRLRSASALRSRVRDAIAHAPVLRHAIASHVTGVFRRV